MACNVETIGDSAKKRAMRAGGLYLLLIALVAGCANRWPSEVTGEVTLDNRPVEYGVISFWPADGVGPSAQGIIQNGKYKVAVAPGMKKVGVEVVEKAGNQPIMGPGSELAPVYKAVSPENYRDPQRTDLRCEISASETTHDFHLKSL